MISEYIYICEYNILLFYLVMVLVSGRPMVIFSVACLGFH